MFQLDIYLAIWINFYTYDGQNTKNATFNFWCSIATLVLLISTPVFLIFARNKTEPVVRELKEREEKEAKGTDYIGLADFEIEILKDKNMDKILTLRYSLWNYFRFLLEDLDSSSWFGRYYHTATMLRDPILSFSLVFLCRWPFLQILSTTLTVGIPLLLSVWYRPLLPGASLFFSVFSPSCYTIANLSYLCLCAFPGSSRTLGWVIGGALTTIMVTTVSYSAWQSLLSAKNSIKKIAAATASIKKYCSKRKEQPSLNKVRDKRGERSKNSIRKKIEKKEIIDDSSWHGLNNE